MSISNVSSQSQVAKTLASYPQAYSNKALAGSGSADPSVGAWIEENQGLYDQIMSGTSGLSQTDQGQFMEWWNWAMSEMNGASSGWGQDMGMDVLDGSGDEGYDVGQSADPFGATPGANGNLVFTDSEVKVGFIGEERPYDVWATDFTLDVSSTAAKVTVENTTDTRFNPAEAVKRITVTDKATGKTSVYYLHDATDAKIKINTPNGKNVSGDITGVTVGNYKKPSETDPNAAPESNVAPEEIDGKLVVEAPIGQTVELTPAASGDDQVWEVYGSYNINCRPSDKVVVTKTGDDTYTIEVLHRDHSKDTYKIQPGSEGNINATAANVSFIEAPKTKNVHGVEVVDQGNMTMSDGSTAPAAPAAPVEVKVPDGWEHLTLNGGAGEGSLDELNGDQPTRMDGETRVYDGQDFNIYPVAEGKNKTTEVAASGTLTINPNSNSEYFKVKVVGNQFVIAVYSKLPMDAANLKETIKVDADLVDQLKINVDPSRVTMEGEIPSNYAGKIHSDGTTQVLADLPENDKNASDIDAIAAETGLDLNNLPAIPDQKVFEFLVKSDTKLRDLLEQMYYTDGNGNRHWSDAGIQAVRDRVIQLLQVLYPQSGVGAPTNGEADGDDITFGGREFDIFNNSTGWSNGPWEVLRMSTEDTTD